jgi:ribosomal protein L16 Arg81 hydroxylase
METEKKTRMIMQELNDKLTEQQKLAIQSKAYYARELEKLLIESENKRIDLIDNNTKQLEVTLTDLENNYKNRSKELDVKISQLKKERDIIQEEADVKLDNVNKIITKKEEYKTVYVKSQQKIYILGILIIINIILLILKLKK